MNEPLIISGYGERQRSTETRFRLRSLNEHWEKKHSFWLSGPEEYYCTECKSHGAHPIEQMYSVTLCRECHAKAERAVAKNATVQDHIPDVNKKVPSCESEQTEPSAAEGWVKSGSVYSRRNVQCAASLANVGSWYAWRKDDSADFTFSGTWKGGIDETVTYWNNWPALRAALEKAEK